MGGIGFDGGFFKKNHRMGGTPMVPHYGKPYLLCFFPIKKLFLWNENLNTFYCRRLLKTCTLHTLIQIFFNVVLCPIWLIWHNLYLCLHIS